MMPEGHLLMKNNDNGSQYTTPQYTPYDYSRGSSAGNGTDGYTTAQYSVGDNNALYDGGNYAPTYNGGMMVDPVTQSRPLSTGRKVAKFVGRSAKLTVRYIFARLLVCLIMGLALGVIFKVLDYPRPILCGMLECIGNFIPIIGEWLSLLGICIPILISVNAKTALFALLIIFGLEIIDNLVLTPLIVGKSMQFKPIIVMLLTIFIGLVCGNILGVLFAIPIAAIIKLAFDIFWLRKSFDDPDVPK